MSTPYQELLKRLSVTVTNKDSARLSPHLANWRVLNELLLLKVPTDDLKKLIILELNDKCRVQILDRLTARLSTQELENLRELITAIVAHGR